MIYLDNCATTRPFDQVVDIVADTMCTKYVNSVAPYALALQNERFFMQCRHTIAQTINASEQELFFTSGGTEGDNTAVFGACARGDGKIIISAVEHPGVYEAAMHVKATGVKVEVLPVDQAGGVDLAALEAALDENCRLVSIMHVNNETGTVNPLDEIVRIVRAKAPKCIIHSDGVQAHLRIALDVKALDIDAYTISAHKIHGPKGIGALYVKSGCGLRPLLYGGGHQEGFRSGTVNLPAVSGYAQACRLFNRDVCEDIGKIKQVFMERLQGCVINAYHAETSPHILSVGFAGLQAATLQNALEEAGVIVGKGSACSSRNARLSRVLQEMHIDRATAEGTVRIGIGAFNTVQEAEKACIIINDTATRLRRFKRR